MAALDERHIWREGTIDANKGRYRRRQTHSRLVKGTMTTFDLAPLNGPARDIPDRPRLGLEGELRIDTTPNAPFDARVAQADESHCP